MDHHTIIVRSIYEYIYIFFFFAGGGGGGGVGDKCAILTTQIIFEHLIILLLSRSKSTCICESWTTRPPPTQTHFDSYLSSSKTHPHQVDPFFISII